MPEPTIGVIDYQIPTVDPETGLTTVVNFHTLGYLDESGEAWILRELPAGKLPAKKLPVKKLPVASNLLATGNSQLATRNWQLATGNLQLATLSRSGMATVPGG